jgi:ribonucleoside-triphosphate reductase
MTNFRNSAAEFVYMRTYSRWLPDKARRETWDETVERFITFITDERGAKIPPKVIRKIRERLLAFEVMPSMRALWTAGPAAKFDNTAMYNCSFQAINSIEAFAEALYILMCGTGYGFRVLPQDLEQLPTVPDVIVSGTKTFDIEDSKKGWADSVKELVLSLYAGHDVNMNYNLVRPAGARLETMGGRASGPAPLATLHQLIRDIFYSARGRKLRSLEAHDICCQIAESVVVGGVRRSSEISLSALDDDDMQNAKTGDYPVRRWMANNSAVYETKPDIFKFMQEWTALAASKTGERGIFNLEAARTTAPDRRRPDLIAGTNPCGEIQLRDREFCNLSEVVLRETDTLDDVLDKIETATWLGAIQATFTHFPYLSKEWKKNCEEERLLGVSLTGQMDAPHLLTPEALKAYKARALRVAKHASQKLEINMPAAITCVKPSGTVSQVVDSAPGLHPRFAPYYIRRYRINSTDALYQLMKDQGIKLTAENGQRKRDWDKAHKLYDGRDLVRARAICPIYDGTEWHADKVNTWVVSFPAKSPTNAVTADQQSALGQLELYKKLQLNWCEHNASITVYVKDNEWLSVGAWVYANWDIVNGIAFLPYEGHTYEQAPYEAITKAEYDEMVAAMKPIDYSQLHRYEIDDETSGAKAYACVGGVCELN